MRQFSRVRILAKSLFFQSIVKRHNTNDFIKHGEMLKSVNVFNSSMKYVDTENGTGKQSDRVIVFLHGNPTSSYLWRNVIPHVKDLARCCAPDLIGMGQSERVSNCKYTFADHFKYLSEWMKIAEIKHNVNLIVHDWGSALGFHWANQNREKVQSIIHMESLVAPFESWDQFPKGGRKIFQAMRSPAGEEMVLQKNVFVERILPSSILRKLSQEEMNSYLAPFSEPGEGRRPTLTWPRQIPFKGDGPDDVISIADDYNCWLSQSKDIPKLLISAKPGFFSSFIEEKTKDWPNHSKVTVQGAHFLQEDSPKEIGQTIYGFLKDKVFT